MNAANPNRLKDRFALVTGGSRGIGRAVARQFAAEGAVVAINHLGDGAGAEESLALARAASAAHGHAGDRHVALEADVADMPSIRTMFDRLMRTWGRLDIVVNNAGIQSSAPSEDLDLVAFQRIVAVNLFGAAQVSSLAVKEYLKSGVKGVIINTSSVHEIIPKPTFLAYSVSKGGLGNLTRTLALEFAAKGIRVNAVAPGAVATDINPWVNDAGKRQAVERHIPMGRVGMPEEIAPLFAFLASDEASYVTGQTIFACGGLTLYGDFLENWSS